MSKCNRESLVNHIVLLFLTFTHSYMSLYPFLPKCIISVIRFPANYLLFFCIFMTFKKCDSSSETNSAQQARWFLITVVALLCYIGYIILIKYGALICPRVYMCVHFLYDRSAMSRCCDCLGAVYVWHMCSGGILCFPSPDYTLVRVTVHSVILRNFLLHR